MHTVAHRIRKRANMNFPDETFKERFTGEDEYANTAVLFIVAASIPAILLNAAAIFVIKHNRRLSENVQFYFYCQQGARIFLSSAFLLWGNAAILWHSTISETIAYKFIDHFFGFSTDSMFVVLVLAQLGMSVNRCLVLAADGKYREYANLRTRYRILFIFGISIGMQMVQEITGRCYAYFDWYLYMFSTEKCLVGTIDYYYSIATDAMYALPIWMVVIGCDVFLIVRLRKRTDALRRNYDTRKRSSPHTEMDTRLQIQMSLTHLINLEILLSVVIQKCFQLDRIHMFYLETIMLFVVSALDGLNAFLLLRTRKRKLPRSEIAVAIIRNKETS